MLVIKPARFKFNLNLEADENIKDVIFAIKKKRPGQRGASIFPKWSLQGLLDFLNSEAFEPLESTSLESSIARLLFLFFWILVAGMLILPLLQVIIFVRVMLFSTGSLVSWPKWRGNFGSGNLILPRFLQLLWATPFMSRYSFQTLPGSSSR